MTKSIKINATGKPLGHLASEIATILMGKNSVDYAPNKVADVQIVIENASKIHFLAKKAADKKYQRYSGYPGGLKKIPYNVSVAKDPTFPLKNAIGGMLPKNKLWSKRMKNVIINP
ncbi:50S ribosomal protein L13 [Patescibacteria group bacterium]